MTDDRRVPRDLEEALRALGRALETSTPTDYPDRVLQQLVRESDAPRGAGTSSISPRRWTARRVLASAAAVLVVAMVLTLANPSARRAVASWFGFAGVEIRHSPTPPLPTPTTPAALHAGRQVTWAEARQASRFRVAQPANLRRPEKVLLRRNAGSVVVTLAYRAAPPLKPTKDTGYALILTEIYDAGRPVLQKILLTGATAVPVQVDGSRGVFVRGPQEIINLDDSRQVQGQPVFHEVAARASANTLIWSRGTTTYRLEGDFSQGRALALAESLK
jgi:hypothetical protein